MFSEYPFTPSTLVSQHKNRRLIDLLSSLIPASRSAYAERRARPNIVVHRVVNAGLVVVVSPLHERSRSPTNISGAYPLRGLADAIKSCWLVG